jgi:hypothetical protein
MTHDQIVAAIFGLGVILGLAIPWHRAQTKRLKEIYSRRPPDEIRFGKWGIVEYIWKNKP